MGTHWASRLKRERLRRLVGCAEFLVDGLRSVTIEGILPWRPDGADKLRGILRRYDRSDPEKDQQLEGAD